MAISTKSNLSKSKILVITTIAPIAGAIRYLTIKARETFINLRQIFIKALILQNFDPKYYILIKTNALGYTISKVLSQLNFD